MAAVSGKKCAGPYCGVTFYPSRSDARYCGNTCRQQAHRERKAASVTPPPVTAGPPVTDSRQGVTAVTGEAAVTDAEGPVTAVTDRAESAAGEFGSGVVELHALAGRLFELANWTAAGDRNELADRHGSQLTDIGAGLEAIRAILRAGPPRRRR